MQLETDKQRVLPVTHFLNCMFLSADTSEAQLQQATDVDVTTQEPKNRRGN